MTVIFKDFDIEALIEKIISNMTGIPLEQMSTSEVSRLLKMETEMHKTVVGQDDAVKIISGAIRRSKAGISSPKHPLGSFIFLGPTGVGKTQLAKALAKYLFGSEDALIRIDMSDYMEKHNSSRLVGAPPGYVGYDEGGQLTEAVRRNPYSIVLFDEIEKAHPDVFNILLQILDDGRITDSQGRTVDFKNTIIIMTSNLGSEYILGNMDNKEELINRELRSTFKPELLNRIDEIIYFNSLGKEVVYEILDKIISEIEHRLDNRKIKIVLTDEAKDYIVNNSFDEAFGARPIKRYVSQSIETMLAMKLINEEVVDNSTVVVKVINDKLEIEKQ